MENVPSRIMFSQFTPSAGSREERPGLGGDDCRDDATSQSSAHFVSVQSQISKVRMLRGSGFDTVSMVKSVCII